MPEKTISQDPEFRPIATLNVGKLACSTPSVLLPSELGRKHLGREVRFQRITDNGYSRLLGNLEAVRHSASGYELVLDSGSVVKGAYGDGATVQFL